MLVRAQSLGEFYGWSYALIISLSQAYSLPHYHFHAVYLRNQYFSPRNRYCFHKWSFLPFLLAISSPRFLHPHRAKPSSIVGKEQLQVQTPTCNRTALSLVAIHSQLQHKPSKAKPNPSSSFPTRHHIALLSHVLVLEYISVHPGTRRHIWTGTLSSTRSFCAVVILHITMYVLL